MRRKLLLGISVGTIIILLVALLLVFVLLSSPGLKASLALKNALTQDDITLCSPENTQTPGGCYLDFVIEKQDPSYCTMIQDNASADNCIRKYEFCRVNTTDWCSRK